MTDHDKNQFLQDLLSDEELNRLRHTSLLRGLQEMRGRRRRALAARVAVLAFPLLLLAAMTYYPRFQPARPSVASNTMAFSAAAESRVEYITADQLFALFPNRQMALVGKAGHQQLIFLDHHLAKGNLE
jgi:hypothetical protein